MEDSGTASKERVEPAISTHVPVAVFVGALETSNEETTAATVAQRRVSITGHVAGYDHGRGSWIPPFPPPARTAASMGLIPFHRPRHLIFYLPFRAALWPTFYLSR
jgi:hypothetical protein